jgi:hypothetical protein
VSMGVDERTGRARALVSISVASIWSQASLSSGVAGTGLPPVALAGRQCCRCCGGGGGGPSAGAAAAAALNR